MTILTRIAYWILHRSKKGSIPLAERADMLYHFSEIVHNGMRHYQEQVLHRLASHSDELPQPIHSFYYNHVPFILEQSVRGIVDYAIDSISISDREGRIIAELLSDMRRDDIRRATVTIAQAQKREHDASHG